MRYCSVKNTRYAMIVLHKKYRKKHETFLKPSVKVPKNLGVYILRRCFEMLCPLVLMRGGGVLVP